MLTKLKIIRNSKELKKNYQKFCKKISLKTETEINNFQDGIEASNVV